MHTSQIMFILVRSVVCGYNADENTVEAIRQYLISPENSEDLYKLSKSHDLAHLVSAGLEKYGLLDVLGESGPKFTQQQFVAVYRYEALTYELSQLTRTLEEAGIDHIPLKGAVLRAFYPEPWMRTSCDIDVLVRLEDLEKAAQTLVDKLGYERKSKTSHDISMYTRGGVHVELHYDLLEDGIVNSVACVLANAWEMATVADGKKHRLVFSDEMFYFFHVAHMAKHFIHGGCGVRPFVDLWILDNKVTANCDAREKLLCKGELLQFCRSVGALSRIWLEGEEHSALTLKMEKYLLSGGAYGNFDNLTVMQNRKKGSKFKYIMQRIFLPYDEIKYGYPILQKHKWLLPIYWVRRWFKLLDKRTARRVAWETKRTSEMSQNEIKEADRFLSDVGLR